MNSLDPLAAIYQRDARRNCGGSPQRHARGYLVLPVCARRAAASSERQRIERLFGPALPYPPIAVYQSVEARSLPPALTVR